MRKKKPTTPLLPPIEVPMLEPRIEGDVDGAYGGVGLRHVEDLRGLVLYVVNPKVGVGGGSVLSLFWGNTNVPVASTPIREEDKNEDRFALTVPLHFIVEDWANPVFARLRPTGGNPIETERIKLRVSLRRPGGLDPDDATPHHQGLVKVVPAQVLLNGVDETTAQAGVKILIRHYKHMRPYDLIILAWGSEEVVHRVQPDEVGKDITLTVDYATISAADNNPLTRVFFWVRDAGGNRPEERARHSAVALIDVHLNQMRPDAPWLEFPGTHTNIIDLLELGGWDAEIKIWVTAAQAAAYSIVTLIWAGTDSEDNSIPHTETKPLTRPGDYSFNIPNSVVVAIAQGSAYVHALFQGSAGELPSQKLSLEVVGESIRWPAPTIDEDLGGHIDRDVNATVRFKLQAVWPANGYIEVIFLVSSADGTIEHRIGRQVDDVPPTPDGDLTFIIYPAELIRFDGRLVDVFYAHTRPEPGSRPQESLRLQIVVGQLQRTLPAPLVDKVVGGQLNPDDIEAYATARSTYSDTKRLDKIRMFWNGPQASTDKVVDVIVDGGTTEHHFDKPYVDENLGESVSVFYSLTRGSELPRYSLITEVLISRALGDLPAPTLLGANVTGPGTAELQPINVVLGTQLVVSYIGMRDDDSIKIRMLGTGNGGSPDIPPKNGNEALQQVRFDISKVAIAANVRGVDTLVRFDYVVTRAGEPIPSAILTVTFKPIPDTELAKTVIRLNQAKGKLLDLNDFTGDATAHIGTWPFITEGYPVWLLLRGKTSNSVDHEHLLFNGAGGAAVTREWASSGSFEWPVPRTYLDGLGHNTKLFMVFKAAFSTSREEVEATPFPTIEYDVNTVQLPSNFPVPILRQATGSGNSVTLAPMNAQGGGTVSVEFLPMYATDNIRVTMVGTSGAGSPAIPAKAGSTGGVVTFDIPATAIGANIGNGNKTFTLKYDVTRDGQTRPSLLLTVTVTPIPLSALPHALIDYIPSGALLNVAEFGSATRWRLAAYPFQVYKAQLSWLTYSGIDINGNPVTLPAWSGVEYEHAGAVEYNPDHVWFKTLRDGSTLTIEVRKAFDKVNNKGAAVVFPVTQYVVKNVQMPIQYPVPVLRQATGSGTAVTLAPLNALSGGTVVVSFTPMDASYSIQVTMVGAGGNGSPTIAAKQGSTSGVVTFDIPDTAIAANIGNSNKTFTLKYDVTRNGITRPSLVLTVTVTPIPAAELANTVIRIIEADTNTKVLDLEKVTAGATSRVGVWPFIRLGQPVWLRLTGYNSDNAAIPPIQVWNGAAGSQVNQGWLDARFLDARIAYNSLKDLGHGKTLTMEFKASLSGSGVEADAIVFPAVEYTINGRKLDDFTDFSNQSMNGWNKGANGQGLVITRNAHGVWFLSHNNATSTGPAIALYKDISLEINKRYSFEVNISGTFYMSAPGAYLSIALGSMPSHSFSNEQKTISMQYTAQANASIRFQVTTAPTISRYLYLSFHWLRVREL